MKPHSKAPKPINPVRGWVRPVPSESFAEFIMRKERDNAEIELGFEEAKKERRRLIEERHETKLERIRKGLRLSYERFAEETGTLSDKTVRGHCQGKPMRLSNKQVYLTTLTRLLKRTITAAEIEN